MLDTKENPTKNSESEKVIHICEILRSTLIEKSSGLCACILSVLGTQMVTVRREMDSTLSWSSTWRCCSMEKGERGRGEKGEGKETLTGHFEQH